MEQVQQEIMVPLADLVDSPYNVRRHSLASIDELAALIDWQGLQHPLKVIEQPGRRARSGKAPCMRFGVVAGKRRRQALLRLLAQGRIGKDHAVRCDLVSEAQAREISMAENSGREPLHPADEFEAFKALIDEGRSVEDVAARFGVEPLTVRRRLKLAALSPKLIALYREGGINLDQLMALTLTDDHALQERAWFESHPWDREASVLRRMLTAGEVQATGNALVRFVGIEAYEAAGGIVRRDLFDSEQAGWISDPELLHRLAAEKLDGIAETVKGEGWAWVEVHVEFDGWALRQFLRCDPTLRRLTPEESQALDEMKRREAELQAEARAMDEGDDDSQVERIELEEEDIAERRAAIQTARQTWRAADKAHAGVVVTIVRTGEPAIVRGLVREADRRAAEAALRSDGKASGGDRERKSSTKGREERDERARDGVPDAPKLSDALLRRLAAHRTAALQATLSANVQLALGALAHVFVKGVFSDGWIRERSAMQLTVQWPGAALAAAADDLPASRAAQVLETAKQGWKDRLPESRDEWLGWLVALPKADLLELLALCAALTVNALPGAGTPADADALAQAAGLNMADWWEPTAASFLNHVPKAQIADTVAEASGDVVASRALLVLNKQALVAEAALRLAGKRWLPVPLRAVASQ